MLIPCACITYSFKAEYVIPQLLIEWILKYRRQTSDDYDNILYGVYYTSTHQNKDFNFPISKIENIAMPVFSPDGRRKNRFCPKLSSLFSLTEPTSNELEKLKKAYDVLLFDENLSPEDNYEISDFGQLEKRLLDEDKFPLQRIVE